MKTETITKRHLELMIRTVVIIGAGKMGIQLAGWLASLGLRVLLFDLDTRAEAALGQSIKKRQVFSVDHLKLITALSLDVEADLARIVEGDWIIEVVSENKQIKQGVFETVDKYRRHGSIVTSNTSGLKVADLCKGRSEDFRQYYFCTHFFNPLLLALLEVVRGPDTLEDLFKAFMAYASDFLGKTVVVCKDTPNFIGNRLGVLLGEIVLRDRPDGMSIADADTTCNIVFGTNPNNVRDVVGHIVWRDVGGNVYNRVTDEEDPFRHYFGPEPTGLVDYLINEGLTGWSSATGNGLYADRGKQMIDPGTRQYVPTAVGDYDSLNAALAIARQGDHIRAIKELLAHDDAPAEFARGMLGMMATYAVMLSTTICEDPYDMDKALVKGFAHRMGIFELMDRLGLQYAIDIIKDMNLDHLLLPWFTKAATGQPTTGTSYQLEDWDNLSYEPDVENLAELRETTATADPSNDAVDIFPHPTLDSLLMAVLCNGMNPIDEAVIGALEGAVDLAEAESGALVICSENPKAFSAGAHLGKILEMIEAGDRDGLDDFILRLQKLVMRIRYSHCPVVSAIYGHALGGGIEIPVACDVIVAALQTRAHQPELPKAGVMAAGGGILNTMRNTLGALPPSVMWGDNWSAETAYSILFSAWYPHGYSPALNPKNAFASIDLGILPRSTVVVHAAAAKGIGHVIHKACEKALALLPGYRPPAPQFFNLHGLEGFAKFETLPIGQGHIGKMWHPHNTLAALEMAKVVCGGDGMEGVRSEWDILDLERAGFLELAFDETGEAIARIKRTLRRK